MALEFASGASTVLTTVDLRGRAALPAGPGVTKFFTVDMAAVNGSTHMLTALCTASSAATAPLKTAPEAVTAVGASGRANVVSLNEIPLVPPSHMVLPPATVHATVATKPNVDGSVDVALKADKTALYVILTTLAHGRFSDNAFALTGSTVVQFVPFGALDLGTLSKTLRVEHLQQNL